MKIERFEVAGLAQYSYVISDGGEAVVIDPMRDIERYVAYAEREKLLVTAVVETHIHADFAAGSMALVQATGAELALSGYDSMERYVYSMRHRRLRDGDTVKVGSVRLQALFTPGHTPEHLSYLLRGSDGELEAMFSGDFLFAGALGRPDLLGEEAKVELAKELYKSVTKRIAGLPDGLAVYPGHGAGSLCGAGLSDRVETTLGYERETNAYFGYGEMEFVEKILASVPPMPTYYPRMKALNAKGSPVLLELPGGLALSVAEVEAMQADVTLLDARGVDAFAAGHAKGAISLGLEGNLSMWAGWLLEAEKPIVLLGDGGTEEAVRLALVRVGLDGIVGRLEGGMRAWRDEGMVMETVRSMTAAEVAEESGEVLVVDVRNDSEMGRGAIAGSQHVALGDLPARLGEIKRGRPVVTVCESGYRASTAASLLQAAGFEDVRTMQGGMGAWRGWEGGNRE
jgi:hydroxyacylglutathione hydrolase